jgi:hypothetical protein
MNPLACHRVLLIRTDDGHSRFFRNHTTAVAYHKNDVVTCILLTGKQPCVPIVVGRLQILVLHVVSIAGLHPWSPCHFAWQPSARVSQTLQWNSGIVSTGENGSTRKEQDKVRIAEHWGSFTKPLLPWKSNKYYIFMCVRRCVWGCTGAGVCLFACSLTYPACNALAP